MAVTKSRREMLSPESGGLVRLRESNPIGVASEPGGRKRERAVDPLRDCYVSAQGLIESERGRISAI